ncbi:hypothetical protein FHR81_001426 [Actinoalloteichus hoggarensis]|uniref:Uncharacterized protein n=1 Tax=Actinoalloteichus hoggarensis TaxID=1470176 RepID=A0A221W070_9PSEU|nr:hypothetical protein AHOG_07575 [Actinoalloteichus hoggarensis]MBB5920396.1 hypothetical protein [Actinoalloteichus hoggarensis]
MGCDGAAGPVAAAWLDRVALRRGRSCRPPPSTPRARRRRAAPDPVSARDRAGCSITATSGGLWDREEFDRTVGDEVCRPGRARADPAGDVLSEADARESAVTAGRMSG